MASDDRQKLPNYGHAFTIAVFVGAYTLFQIQPLVGKIVTAQFGGASAIWCVCLLFFQTALLGGYTLTYLLTRLPLKVQCITFAVAAVASAIILNIPDATHWTTSDANPISALLKLLTIHLGLACILMSATSGLMQSWYARRFRADPYHLYSVSNIGSMSALLLYPIAIEPFFGVNSSIQIWRTLYSALAGLIAVSAVITGRFFDKDKYVDSTGAQPEEEPTGLGGTKPTLGAFAKWVFLSSLGSCALLTYTVYLTQDVAPVPLLWVLPLCIYLLTFIICFGKKGPPDSAKFLYLAPLLWFVDPFVHNWLPVDVACVLAFIFCACMALHGEIVRSKPSAHYLPTFYLAIAFGGVVGSLYINFAAPMMFNFYAEREIIVFCLLGFCYYQAARNSVQLLPNKWINSILIILLITMCALKTGLMLLASSNSLIARTRNFYGCLSITRTADTIDLTNGGIIHGTQFTEPSRRMEPSRYYRKSSGIALIEPFVRRSSDGTPIKIGVIGLGTGTIAAYGKPGDEVTFYELDKDVETVARNYFTFLSGSQAKVNVIIGDARVKLEAQQANNYDLFVVDAFNGDAVPVHLLTKEAVQLYFKHIKHDGVLLIHASNRYVNLEPVVANIAANLKLNAVTIDSGYTRYIAVTIDPLPQELMTENPNIQRKVRASETDASMGIWTDDYNNLAAAVISNIHHHVAAGDFFNERRGANSQY